MKRFLKRTLAAVCALVLLLGILPTAAFAGGDVILPPDDFSDGDSVDFAVLSTTDMHGKCWDTNVLTDGTESNNMLKVKTAVSQIRKEFKNVILVDNGDLYQGTPVSSVQLNKYTQGLSTDPLAMAVCLADIGYTASVLGNHEFNYAWKTMQDARAYLEGQGVPTICANLYYEATGENVFTPYITKNITVGSKTLKVGILGLESTDCTRWDIPDNYPGIIFHHPDNPECSIAWEVSHYVPIMKAAGCNFIIVSYHGGTGSSTGDLVFGVNTEGQATRMIAETTGVDMVIAGHDHSVISPNTYIKNKDGKDVLIVNGGGTQLTKTVFTATVNGSKIDVAVKASQNITLSSYASDATLKAKIKPYADLASEYVNQEAGKCIGTWDKETNFYLKQSNSMDLIQAAQIYEGSKYIAKKFDTPEKQAELFEKTGLDHLDIDMSSTSVVVNGSYCVKAGSMTMKDIYRLYKYDNNLYVLPLTGAQIKAILEQNASTRLKATVKDGKVSYSTIGESFTNPVFGGLNFTYDMYQPEGERVIIDGFANGRAFDLKKVYLVGVNNYHLGNVGCGFGNYSTTDAIWSQTDDMGGGVCQDLIMEYLTDMTKEKGGVDPATFNWTWKLDYSGDPDEEQGLTGDILAKEVTALSDGQKIMIYCASEGVVMSTEPATNTARLDGVEATVSGSYLGTNAPAAIFTVELIPTPGAAEGEDLYFALKTESGNYLTSGETGNSLGFSAELTDLGMWYLEEVDGGFHIRNVGAAYNNNHNQALEWYSGFTTYGVQSTPAFLFNIYEPIETASVAAELEDGGRYAIYYDAEGTFLSTDALNGGLAPVTNTLIGDKLLLPAKENTFIFTAEIVATNGEDPIYIFKTDDGKYLTAGNTGNSLSLTDSLNDMSKWYLVAVDGGFHIMNVGAAYGGNHNQAIEFYSGRFTTYGVQDTPIYLYNFYEIGGEITPPAPCAHEQTELRGAKDATCTEDGYTGDTYCVMCGTQLSAGKALTALGHDYQMTLTEPTYLAEGYELYQCSRCTDSYKIPIEKLYPNHYYLETWEEQEDWTGIYMIAGMDYTFDSADDVWYASDLKALSSETDRGTSILNRCDADLGYLRTSAPSAANVFYFEKVNEYPYEDRYTIRSLADGSYLKDEGIFYQVDDPDILRLGFYWNIRMGEDGNIIIDSNGYYLIYNDEKQCFEVEAYYTIGHIGYPACDYYPVFLFKNGCVCAEFNDVDIHAWYHEGVEYMVNNYIMNGMSEHTFEPNGKVTRAQLVTILYRIAGTPDVTGLKNPFTDVLNGSWYTDAVIWAADQGIVNGMTETTYAPNDNITREQIATILYRYAGKPAGSGNLNGFADASSVSPYALDAMAWAVGEGIIGGMDGKLAPKDNATRAQIATILYRYLTK